MNSKAKILTGIAGEYFVAGELSRRGYIASITLRNTEGTDILASDGQKAVNIQVKTRCIERATSWDLGSKPLKYEDVEDGTFYVMVAIHSDPKNKEIVYHIFPKTEFNKKVEENFQENKKKPKKNGDPKTTNWRRFIKKDYPEYQTAKYTDNWDILFN